MTAGLSFLLRLIERGKEPHAEKSKLRHDIAERLLAAVPDARLRFEVGRIYVEAPRDIRDEIAKLHGVSSFSPCFACDLEALGERTLAVARERLAPGMSFRVKVRRVGTHPFSSSQKAAELGAKILESVPGVRVDLRAPDVELVIEICGRSCHVCPEVIAGLDARLAEQTSAISPEPPPSGEPRFLVDAMLGTLATRLRAFGYDTEWRRDTADSLLLRESAAEGRVVLTQDRELATIGGRSAYFVRGRTVEEQIAEVAKRFGLSPTSDRLFSRCSICNTKLSPVDKEAVRDRVPAKAFAHYDEFWICEPCDKIYWKGSHHEELRAILRAFQRG